MPGGRPTKYKPEYCKKLMDYFNRDLYEWVDVLDSKGKPVKGEDGEVIKKRELILYPTVEKFARIIGVNRDTLYEWAKKHKEFSDTLTHAQEIQESLLQQGALNNAYNQNFAQFILKNKHNWKDKQEVDTNVNLAGEIKINIVTNKKDIKNEQ